jgi:hypothetical protein
MPVICDARYINQSTVSNRQYPVGSQHVQLINLALALIVAVMIMTIGWKAYLMIQLPEK